MGQNNILEEEYYLRHSLNYEDYPINPTSMLRLLLLCLLVSATAVAQTQTTPTGTRPANQTKRPLTHADYDRWQGIRAEKISDDGRWVCYQIDPQEGDGMLELKTSDGKKTTRFPRGYLAQFTADNTFLLMRLKVPYADTQKAKLKKTKPDQMPKDSMLALNLATGEATKLPNVKSFIMGKEGGSWVAVTQSRTPDKAPKAVASKDTMTATSAAGSPAAGSPVVATKKATPGKSKSDDLTLLNLADGTRRTFRYVSSAAMSANGQTIFYSKDALSDSLKLAQPGAPDKPGVYQFDLTTRAEIIVDTNAKFRQYKGLAVDKIGTQLAWMASADSAGAEAKAFALYYKNLRPAPAKAAPRRTKAVLSTTPFQTLADTTTLPNHWSVNEFSTPKFSDDGQRLYFSTSPVAMRSRKDSLTPDDEKVKVDVWSWTDSRLQPMQQKRLKQEKERGFVAVYDLASRRLTPLASREVASVAVDYKANPRYLLGESDEAYQVASSWDPGHTDLYLIDTQTGERKKIANDIMASSTRLSPGGKYAYWYDERDSLWRAYSVQTRKLVDLTRGLPAKFFDEEHDSPSLPGSYGAAGWTKEDRHVWIYDRYDIWQLDPTGAEKPQNVTAGWGRTNKVRLRRSMLTPQDSTINAQADLWLTGFWESDKHWGILKEKTPTSADRTIAVMAQSKHRYAGLQKAKNAPTLTYLRGNFQEPYNLFVTDTTFSPPAQLTRINPQQDSVRWGSVELISWMGTNGTKLEGLLYKPEDFSPTKKYPMLVYYYERNSETMNDYKAPSPSRSTINVPYCVSNGYLVFVPDIVYTVGQPGPDAYDCVVPGVLSLLDRGFVDRDRIGLQGQSWGGYQTAYLITRTNLFKAAMAGAPVANMTSAYGGIRWGTGMSRMFQYEKTQSRIGGTLWEKPLSYIENSPLFAANRIETPLMMMHNDADGSVPWYQGIEMFTALRRLNKPVWMVTYNGEDHNLTMRHNMKDLSVRLYQFFDYYLKDAPMPAWMKEGRTAVEKDRGELKY